MTKPGRAIRKQPPSLGEPGHEYLYNNTPSVIILINLKGKIEYVNDYIKEISHYRSEDLIGRKFLSVLAPESRERAIRAFKRVKNGRTVKAYELAIIDKNGDYFYVRASGSPIKCKGKIVGIFGFATDITVHKKNLIYLSKIIKEMSILYDIGEQLSSTINLDLLFSKILMYLSQTFGYQRAGILLIDRKHHCLIMRATTRPFAAMKQHRKIPLDRGITGHVATTGKAYICNNTRKNRHYLALDRKTRSEVTVPLIAGDKTIGVINVESYTPNAFDNDDIRILTLIARQAAIAIENSRLYESLEESYLDTIKALVSAMEAKDHYTRGHSERVRKYAMMIANRLKLNEQQLKELNHAGYLHDIGKIGIKDTLLSKVEPLTDDEYELIKKHPEIGNGILKDVKHLASTCAIIRCEHERYDGNGYPHGLKKTEIPLGARIIAVADAFDAMTTDRPYRRAISKKRALKVLKDESGKQFDPKVVKTFLAALKRPKK
jgi:PAS domain S-box-containing protein